MALALLILPSACGHPTKAKTSLPTTLTFDESKHHLYVYGRSIRSPAILAYRNGELTVNGFGPPQIEQAEAIPLDSAMARGYRNVPFFRGQVREGKSVLEAGRAYEAAFETTLDRAIRVHQEAELRGDPDSDAKAIASLDTSIVDMRRPVSFGERSIAVTLRGMTVNFEHVLARRRPPPQDPEADLQRRAIGRARDIEDLVRFPKETVIIVSRVGMGIWQTKPEMDTVMAEIEVARTQYRSPEEWFKKRRQVPQDMIEEFAWAERDSLDKTKP